MTKSKFWRLFLVLLVPLILAGVVSTRVGDTQGAIGFLVCDHISTSGSICRNLGRYDSDLYQRTKKQSHAWFEVNMRPFPEGWFSVYATAPTTVVHVAEIVNVSPSPRFSQEANAVIRKMVGQPAIMQLGIKDEKSSISKDVVVLACNSIDYSQDQDMFSSGCYGDGWYTTVEYRLAPAHHQAFMGLKDEIRKEGEELRKGYIIRQASGYLVFVFLFLLISLIAWLVVKAIAFVKRG